MRARLPSIASAVFFCLALIPLYVPQAAASEKLRLAATIPAQEYFLEQIGGDRVTVEILLPPGADPHTYEPRPAQLRHLDRVQSYFSIGLHMESAWLERFREMYPDMRIVPMHSGIERRPMPESYEEALKPVPPAKNKEEHGHSGESNEQGQEHSSQGHDHSSHEHEESGHEHCHHLDPHVWLSPPLARIMAQNVREELIRIDPENAEEYNRNYLDLARRLSSLDRDLSELFAGVERRVFLVFHPSWGYFARAYGLNQIPIELEGRQVTAKRMSRLISIAREQELEAVFVQPQFSSRAAEQLAAELDLDILEIDPLAADWEANLRDKAEKIRKSLE